MVWWVRLPRCEFQDDASGWWIFCKKWNESLEIYSKWTDGAKSNTGSAAGLIYELEYISIAAKHL